MMKFNSHFLSISIISSLCLISSMSLFFISPVYADSSIEVQLANGQKKLVSIMPVHLKPEARRTLVKHASLSQAYLKQSASSKSNALPERVNLGMNDVPVLDQGVWGTCATFAATAAIDAMLDLKQDNQVSQLCHLQLSRTLKLPDIWGGWEGSYGQMVLKQLQDYGYWNIANQKAFGCGGLYEYPSYSYYKGKSMTKSDYMNHQSGCLTSTNWKELFVSNSNNLPNQHVMKRLLLNIKQQLNVGRRVIFGTLLDISNNDPGAVGEYHHVLNDTWVLNKSILNHILYGNEVGGHEMVIIGYDDQACADYIDENNVKQQQCGLLRLRNSWSADAGDHGDYYMSYLYFSTMVLEAYAVGQGAGV